MSNHIGLALRAFLRIDRHCFTTGISWFEAKASIIRDAVRAYLAQPIYTLQTQLHNAYYRISYLIANVKSKVCFFQTK